MRSSYDQRCRSMRSRSPSWVLQNLYEFVGRSGLGTWRSRLLGRSPRVEDGYLVHARNRTMRRAGFFGEILTPQVLARIGRQRHSWISALLRTVVHKPVLADVKIAAAGAAAPIVGLALRDVVLKRVDARKTTL